MMLKTILLSSFAALSAVILFLPVSSAFGRSEYPDGAPPITYTWDGGGGDANWSTGSNWVGNVAPTPATDADLIFTGIVQTTNNNDFAAGSNFGSITFSAGGFTIGGNSITLNGNVTNGTGTNTIDLAMDLAATTNVTTTQGIIIWNGVISGSGGLNKSGGGQVFLFGNNTYTGTTTVNSGHLNLRVNNALGSTAGGTTVATGGNLRFINVNYTSAEPVTINGTGSSIFGSLRSGGGAASTFAGPITLASASTIGTGNTGQLILNGTIDNGGFALEIVATTSFVTINGVISGSGALIKKGGTVLALAATNTYTGTTTINSGIVFVSANGALGAASAGTTVTGLPQRLEFIGGVNYTTPEPVTINGSGGGYGAIANNSGNNSFAGPVTLGSASTIGALNGSLTLSGGLHNAGFDLTLLDDITISEVISGTGGLIKNVFISGGASTLSSANTYSGSTTINAGTLAVSANGALGTTEAGTTVVGGAEGSLQFTGSVNYSTAEPVTINGAAINGGILSLGTNTFAGPITLGSASQILASGGGVLTLNGTINTAGFAVTLSTSVTHIVANGAISGAGSLMKTHNGILTLTAANPMTGTTTLMEGILLVNGSLSDSNVTVNISTLGGTNGTVGTISTAGTGMVSPGAASAGSGILNSGNVSLASTSSFEVELNGTTAGTGYDQLNVTGTVSLGSASLTGSVTFAPGGASFTIINNDGAETVTGTFAGLPESSSLMIGGESFLISYVGGDGNDVVLFHVPPEHIFSDGFE